MRKLSSAVVVAVLVLSGIVVAQTKRDISEAMAFYQKKLAGPQCKTPDDAMYGPDAVAQWNGQSYRCAYMYDSWMTRTSHVTWVKVRP